jgi:aspartate kinase
MSNLNPSTSGFSQSQIAETDFEKRRGISDVEVRPGFTQVHINDLPDPVSKSRVKVLDAVASAGISLDFLKLTPKGLSFLVPASKTETVKSTMEKFQFQGDLATNRSIILVHAVNMRDEEGMIAQIVRKAITAGVPIDHVTDMHDRMLIVTSDEQALVFQENLRNEVLA